MQRKKHALQTFSPEEKATFIEMFDLQGQFLDSAVVWLVNVRRTPGKLRVHNNDSYCGSSF